MRTIGIFAGVLSFAAIAVAGEAVVFKSDPKVYEGHFIYGPGTTMQQDIPIKVERSFSFIYPDAKLDPKNSRAMAFDKELSIEEYLESDVNSAIAEANRRGRIEKKPVRDILPAMLERLPREVVDCRVVGRKMVEELIESRIKIATYPDGHEAHRYQLREPTDQAIIARNLDRVVISRDATIGNNDIEPRYTCRETNVGGKPAKCGDLRIRFNPLEATDGAFKGKKAVIFNPEVCRRYEDMDFRACELLVQVKRCGLRYTQKAEGDRVANISTQGIDDALERFKDDEMRARQNGAFQAAQNGPNAMPDDFYGEFKRPAGASKPAQ